MNVSQNIFFTEPVNYIRGSDLAALVVQAFTNREPLYYGTAAAFLAAAGGVILFVWGIRKKRNGQFKRPEQPFIIPLALSVIAFFALVRVVDVQSCHHLECPGYITDYSLFNFRQMLLWCCLAVTHFPLYPFLLKVLSPLSDTLESVRMVSVFFFSLSIFMFFRLAALLFNKKTTFFCTTLFGLSPFLLYYAVSAQPYALVLLLSVSFTYYFVLHIQENRGTLLPLVITGVLGGYTHPYFYLVPVSALGSLVIIPGQRRQRFRNMAPALGIMVFLLSPMVVFGVLQIHITREALTAHFAALNIFPPETLPTAILHLRDMLLFFGFQFSFISQKAVFMAGLIFLAVTITGYIMAFRQKNESAIFYVGLLLLALTGAYSYTQKLYGALALNSSWWTVWRYCIVAVPFLFLACGSLIQSGLSKHRAKLLYVVLAATLVFQLYSAREILLQKTIPDSKSAWSYIQKQIQPGDIIIVSPSVFLKPTFLYYVRKHSSPLELGRFFPYLDYFIPYEDIRRTGFVKRVWNVRYDFKFYGLYTDIYRQHGEKAFDSGFSDWELIEEKGFPFLSVRLLSAPAWPAFEGKKLNIYAGKNDILFIRNVSPVVSVKQSNRTILQNTQLIVPFATGRQLKSLTLINHEMPGAQELSKNVTEVPHTLTENGYLFLLDWAAGFQYNEIVLGYE